MCSLQCGVRMQGDAIYFEQRANEERVAAMRAPHPSARQAHLEMAERYDDLASALSSREPLPPPELAAPA